jgi:predicted glutamine amidotransferase
MCELFGLSSRIPTVVSISLMRFAHRGGLDGRTLDGWGLAFYDGSDVRLFREPEPARDSVWLPFIEQRRVPSALVVSHIRHATQGRVALANTQPFVREYAGRMHCFAHNGKLADVEARHGSELRQFHPIGETDSEVAACALFERLARLWSPGATPTLDSRMQVVRTFAAAMRERGPANFLYVDGDAMFAHGHRRTQTDGRIVPPGLWWLSRRCAVDHDALPDAGVRVGEKPANQQLVLFASVPLTDEDWRPLEEGEVIAVQGGEVRLSSSRAGS